MSQAETRLRVLPRVVRFLDAPSHGARRPIHFGALAPALHLSHRAAHDRATERPIREEKHGQQEREEGREDNQIDGFATPISDLRK